MRKLFFMMALLSGMNAQASFDWDPFYERLDFTNGVTLEAWRPFYSVSHSPERWRKDYLWPFYTQKGFKAERYSRFLFFGYHTDFSPDTDRERVWVIPFYFQGTSAQGNDYFALFPFGGTIDEFMGRDHIRFVLFPLYVQSSINDVHTTSILWPVGSRTTGGEVQRFRIWPLYGRSTLEGQFEKSFVLWPIFNRIKYTNLRNPGGGFIIIPLYGRIVTQQAVNYWIIPPLFRYAASDEQTILYAPWPFIQWGDGDVHLRYFWPLYGKKEVGSLSRQFWLWPIFWNSRTEYLHHDLNRRRALPFFHYESEVVTEADVQYEVGEVKSRYWKLWPLMSWERQESASRFRLLELWPLRNTAGIERNWAPIWTLYKREEQDGAVGHRLLWGLYGQTKGNGDLEWSLLKGLAGYKNIDGKRTFKLMFFHLGGKKE